MLGPSWDPVHPRCDTRWSSLGAEQLRWLQRQLADGAPTFVFVHHPLPGGWIGGMRCGAWVGWVAPSHSAATVRGGLQNDCMSVRVLERPP